MGKMVVSGQATAKSNQQKASLTGLTLAFAGISDYS
jgi:hypothetical protein